MGPVCFHEDIPAECIYQRGSGGTVQPPALPRLPYFTVITITTRKNKQTRRDLPLSEVSAPQLLCCSGANCIVQGNHNQVLICLSWQGAAQGERVFDLLTTMETKDATAQGCYLTELFASFILKGISEKKRGISEGHISTISTLNTRFCKILL